MDGSTVERFEQRDGVIGTRLYGADATRRNFRVTLTPVVPRDASILFAKRGNLRLKHPFRPKKSVTKCEGLRAFAKILNTYFDTIYTHAHLFRGAA